jgi:hypothetical protein
MVSCCERRGMAHKVLAGAKRAMVRRTGSSEEGSGSSWSCGGDEGLNL